MKKHRSRIPSLGGLLVLAAFLTLPTTPGTVDPDVAPVGGAAWICLAYGALAGASVMSGNVWGAMGLTLAAAGAGCFG